MPENSEGRENEQEEIEPVIEYAQKGDCSAIAEVDRDRMLQRLEEHGCPLREFNKEERVEQLKKEMEFEFSKTGGGKRAGSQKVRGLR